MLNNPEVDYSERVEGAMSGASELQAPDPSAGSEYPVTVTQEAVLLGREVMRQRNMAGQSDYMSIILRLSGPLCLAALREALNGLLKRHAALRTRFLPNKDLSAAERAVRLRSFSSTGVFTPGLYLQSVEEKSVVALPITDLTDIPKADQQTVFQERYQAECSLQANWDAQSRIRAGLIRLAAEDHALFLLVDHLVCDLRSADLIRRDLLRFYEQFLMPEPGAVEPTEMSFLDYASWQRAQIAQGRFDVDAAYWRDQWAEYGDARIAPSELPFFVSSPAGQSGSRGTTHAESGLTEEITAAVVRRAHELCVSVHTFVFTAFCILLRHYTGRDKLACVGHFANRSRPETADAVGFFMHSHLIGIDISSSSTFSAVVAQAKKRLLGALAHEQMPPPLLWQLLRSCPRVMDVRPLVDTYSAVETSFSLPDGVVAELIPAPMGQGQRFSSLGLYVNWEGPRIVLMAQTSLALFSPASAATIAKDMTYLLAQIVSTSAQESVGAIPMPEKRLEVVRAVALASREMNEYMVLSSRLIPTVPGS